MSVAEVRHCHICLALLTERVPRKKIQPKAQQGLDLAPGVPQTPSICYMGERASP